MTLKYHYFLYCFILCFLSGCDSVINGVKEATQIEDVNSFFNVRLMIGEHISMANGNSQLHGCSGSYADLKPNIKSEHIQSWTYLYERNQKQYFMGAASATEGGHLFIVERRKSDNASCVVWSQTMNMKGGNGLDYNNIWGYWDHPSQVSFVEINPEAKFAAITVNCFLGECSEEDEGGIIFVNVDNPEKPFKYPTNFYLMSGSSQMF